MVRRSSARERGHEQPLRPILIWPTARAPQPAPGAAGEGRSPPESRCGAAVSPALEATVGKALKRELGRGGGGRPSSLCGRRRAARGVAVVRPRVGLEQIATARVTAPGARRGADLTTSAPCCARPRPRPRRRLGISGAPAHQPRRWERRRALFSCLVSADSNALPGRRNGCSGSRQPAANLGRSLRSATGGRAVVVKTGRSVARAFGAGAGLSVPRRRALNKVARHSSV
jgi:hypothetical protein